MNWISKIWNRISHLGIQDLKSAKSRTYILSNQLNITLLIIMIVLSAIMMLLRIINDTSITISSYRLLWMMSINFLHIILSYYNRGYWSKSLLIFSAPLIFIIIPTMLSFVENDSFFNYSEMIIALSLIPQLLVRPWDQKGLYISSMVYYLALLILHDDLVLRFDSHELTVKPIYREFKIYAEITAIAIFIFINSSVYYLKWLNNNYEKKLMDNNQELDQHIEELKATNQHLKATQQQLVQSEKMASLGILTAGVAHEINTPLNFISTSSVLVNNAIEDLKDDVDRKQVEASLYQANEILDKGVEQAALIVSSLMTFSYDGKSKKTMCDLEAIINSTLLFIKSKIPLGLTFEIHNEIEEPIYAFPDKMHQVILNIIDNAICASATVEDKLIKIRCYTQTKSRQKLACISIYNNGPNISKEVGARIFDPFYTTKDINEGTGLGLSTSFNLVKDHQGEINYINHAEGVEFLIQLPFK
ncbi:sensor histidine kinase [Carboxylicivirga marina]|uniref:histidine kinase n=1 Tax=Carboxylicivirga marina TaxID=2800988 RepID=A0ABS1HP20_9BACT|nr:ATP-binding protein [Carboxylicivirga marina]MBK3519432.1 GHKL domain-containing protein [Carboxylicivirga marina]